MTQRDTDLMPLSGVAAWVRERVAALGAETVSINDACGRIAAAGCVARTDWPPFDRAAGDGFALRAADSEGAGSYNPLPLALVEARGLAALPPGAGAPVTAGAPLPPGADAVLPFEAAQLGGAATLEVLAPVARGAGVERRGCEARAGTEAVPARTLRPADIALLAATGVTHVDVVRRPLVRLVVAGPKAGGPDALTPMLRALVARDGGCAEVSCPTDAGRSALAEAIARPPIGIDLLLVAGRCGAGVDDDAPQAFADAGGRLDAHGIAMRPGGSAGLGVVGGVPTVLLPGTPLGCLAAYDMVASGAVRRLAGHVARLAYRVAEATLDRKIVSALGLAELVRVRVAGGRATPLGSAESGGLAGVARSDGFVVVPAGSEGHPPGSVVRVHLYDELSEGERA